VPLRLWVPICVIGAGVLTMLRGRGRHLLEADPDDPSTWTPFYPIFVGAFLTFVGLIWLVVALIV
jgi:hypothetical protein